MLKQSVLVAVFIAQAWSSIRRRDEVYLGELGCIPLRDCPGRPFDIEPDARRDIDTTFMIGSREHSGGWMTFRAFWLTHENLRGTTFAPTRRTMLIVHGWMSGVTFTDWMIGLRNNLLDRGDFNVILVDWSRGSHWKYWKAVSNTRVVGAEIGLLVKKLQETFGISPSSVHAYGHSLGGQVVAFAGKWLNGTLGRITALDPASPFFESCPPEARLAKTDAQFVEVVHTDSGPTTMGGFGMDLPVGDVDFYPNGGQQMPGCLLTDRLVDIEGKKFTDAAQVLVACNHVRAIDYTRAFLENSNRNSTCLPIAFACPNYDSFENGHCSDCGEDGSRCAVMTLDGAEYALRFRGKYRDTKRMYFKTGPRPPFCLYHYQIEMKLFGAPSGDKVYPVSGELYILIKTKSRESLRFDLKHASGNTFTRGATYRYLLTSKKPLENVYQINFNFDDKAWLFSTKIHLEYIKFTPMTTTSRRADFKKLSKMFCPSRYGIGSRKESELKESFC